MFYPICFHFGRLCWVFVISFISMTEAQLEHECTKIAKADGYYDVRILKSGRSGVPDHIYLKGKRAFFVEFKTETGRLSRLQEYEIKTIKNKGIEVYVIRTIDEFKRVLK